MEDLKMNEKNDIKKANKFGTAAKVGVFAVIAGVLMIGRNLYLSSKERCVIDEEIVDSPDLPEE